MTRRLFVFFAFAVALIAFPHAASAEALAFPSGQDTVELPFRLLHDHIIVRVTVNGHGLDFVLDSGAGNVLIDPAAATQLGLTLGQKTTLAGNAGTTTSASTTVAQMTIGPLTMTDVPVMAIPFGEEPDANIKVVGLLGFDFFNSAGVTIDYVHQRVIVQRVGTYEAPSDPHTIPLEIDLDHHVPMVSVIINGVPADHTIVDTGNDSPFIVFDYFARQHPEALVDHLGGATRAPQFFFSGIGGHFDTRAYQIESLQLGNTRFADILVYRVISSKAYRGDASGLFGTLLLRVFDVHFDYPNHMLYLVPNDIYRRAAR